MIPQQQLPLPGLFGQRRPRSARGLPPIVVQAHQRIRWGMALVACLSLVLCGRLVMVTIAAEQPARVPAASTAATALPPVSGRRDIVDRHGQLLATSLPVVSLAADPARVLDAAAAVMLLRSVLPDLDHEKLLTELRGRKRFVWIRRHLSPAQHEAILRLGLPGFMFEREERRFYPQGALTAHVLGFTGIDGDGLAGLERGQDAPLRSSSAPLALALDVRVQHILHQALQAAMEKFRAIGGAGVVMDAWSGEILALVSLPDFDPLHPASAGREARFNRATLGSYEPGSTAKIFNTALALEQGIALDDRVDASAPIRRGRFTINDFKPENRWLNIAEVFVHSSNIGSARMVERVGITAQQRFLERLGVLAPLALEIGERGQPQPPAQWGPVESMTIAYGHGFATTPLHLMRATAALVTDGRLIEPTFLKRPAPTRQGPVLVNTATLQKMRQLLRLAVRQGTATIADVPGYAVGGKTGTAEKNTGRRYDSDARLSSFIAVLPMDAPRYVIYAMLDEPKPTAETFGYATGGWVAAPVVASVVTQAGPLLGLLPEADNTARDTRLNLPLALIADDPR